MADEPTGLELAAARALAAALAQFLVAYDHGRIARERRARPPVVEEAPLKPPEPKADSTPKDVALGRGADPRREPEPLPEKLLVTSREAASLLSVSERTLWSITAPRGPIPAIRLGKAVRYAVDDLLAWIEKASKSHR